MQGTAYLPAAVASDRLRLVIFWDNEALGANPASTDVFETNNIDSCYQLDKVGPGKRFSMIYDRVYPVITPAASVATGLVPITGTFKLDKNVFYQSNAGTLSDILKNNMVVGVISAGGTSLIFNVNFQLCFTDI